MYLSVINDRRVRRNRRLAGAAILSLLGLCLAMGTFAVIRAFQQLTEGTPSNVNSGGIESVEPAPDYRASRENYPYSVVPGGVENAREAQQSIAHDPVVERHYRGINVAQLMPRRLTAPIEVYASYRVRDSVFWTQHKIRLREGELVLSDGQEMIRGRCGNRLSFFIPPMPPGLQPPPVEPPEFVFDHGLPPILPRPEAPDVTAGLPLPAGPDFWPPTLSAPPFCCESTPLPGTPGTPPVPATPGGGGGWWWPPIPPPIPPGGGPPPGPPGPPPKPPATPEPGTMLLMATGVVASAIKIRGKG